MYSNTRVLWFFHFSKWVPLIYNLYWNFHFLFFCVIVYVQHADQLVKIFPFSFQTKLKKKKCIYYYYFPVKTCCGQKAYSRTHTQTFRRTHGMLFGKNLFRAETLLLFFFCYGFCNFSLQGCCANFYFVVLIVEF